MLKPKNPYTSKYEMIVRKDFFTLNCDNCRKKTKTKSCFRRNSKLICKGCMKFIAKKLKSLDF